MSKVFYLALMGFGTFLLGCMSVLGGIVFVLGTVLLIFHLPAVITVVLVLWLAYTVWWDS